MSEHALRAERANETGRSRRVTTTSDSSAEVRAPRSWTSERVDTLFVDEPVRKAAAHSPNRASGASETKTARAAPSKRAARM